MAIVEVTQVVSAIAGTGAAVGAVGTASLGVKVLINAFRSAREAGLSTADSFRSARAEKAFNDQSQSDQFERNPLWRGK